MSRFLQAAYVVLRDAAEPLSAADITDRALARGLLVSSGQTPAQTMKSKLATDILRHPDDSFFMRSAAGKFALRSWASRTDEFVAPRYAKALLDEEVFVFPTSRLNVYVPSPGLWDIEPSLGSQLLHECRPMQRSVAEEDTEVIQLVSGFVVMFAGKVLTYKRTKRLPESRLHGEFSLLFGGHLNPEDFPPLFNVFEPSHARLMERELHEELRLRPFSYDLALRGILYDDGRPVSRQHLAIVYDVKLKDPDYVVGERGFLQQDKFETWEQVGQRLQEFENWSQLLYVIYSGGGR